ncbi:hypothetical protein F8M41_017027 [Gigaspora margarita]|uniref:Uncharacterized protein n=1 Tax=Gigaspora margarita TaxID=4874 RepID=A0A8H4ANY1_GIGMA|nr:hypothetical protein F8M41_017027 [Gigaspora margarita]
MNFPITREVDLENAEDNNGDDAENVEDDNVDNIKDYQPKTEESVQDNLNSETNVEGKKSSSKDKKLSTWLIHNSKKVNYLAANSDND